MNQYSFLQLLILLLVFRVFQIHDELVGLSDRQTDRQIVKERSDIHSTSDFLGTFSGLFFLLNRTRHTPFPSTQTHTQTHARVSSFYCYYKQNKHDTRPLPCGDVASLVQKTERNSGQSQQHLEESHTLWTH